MTTTEERPVITSSIESKKTTQTVELGISGGATITVGAAPFGDEEHHVTGLCIGYEVTETAHGNVARVDTRITQITYRTDEGGASVHPDFLDQPSEWPQWVRELVEEHRPTP
jgi:hypothetical protein